MIPKDSTPIKNKILIDILAKGLLSKDEMRIIFYIIRWSWGFNGVGRRQDWTKALKKRKIADDIGMKESQLNRIINKMTKENKIIIKNKCYQFNEHYEKWENLTNCKVSNKRKLNKKLSKTSQIVKVNLTKSKVKLNKKLSLGSPKNSGDSIKNKDLKGGEHTSKDNKETLKDNKDIILSQIKNLLGLFPGTIQERIRVYWDNAAQKNKTGIITEGRKLTLLTELYNLMKRTNDNSLFEYALETANRYGVPNIGYLGAVIKNKITEVTE